MKKPSVSVIIPTYNQAHYLPKAIESVLHQTFFDFELIVINDGSTDETAQWGKHYRLKDKRICWIDQANQGASHARNRGILEASGDFICFLDSDDWMDPQRLEQQLKIFQENLSVDVLYTALKLIDSQDRIIGELHSQDLPPENFLAWMLFRNLIPTISAVMAKSHCFKDNPFNAEFKHAEDYELNLRLAHQFNFKYLDIPLTYYRRHAENLSNNLEAHREAERKILSRYSQIQIEEIVDETSFEVSEKALLKGKIFYNQEHFEQAMDYFDHLNLNLALFYKGNCHFRLGDIGSAVMSYRQAIDKDETNAACWNNLGVGCAKEGNLIRARECFQQALNLKKGYMDAQFNLEQVNQDKTKEGDWRITWRELREQLIPYQ